MDDGQVYMRVGPVQLYWPNDDGTAHLGNVDAALDLMVGALSALNMANGDYAVQDRDGKYPYGALWKALVVTLARRWPDLDADQIMDVWADCQEPLAYCARAVREQRQSEIIGQVVEWTDWLWETLAEHCEQRRGAAIDDAAARLIACRYAGSVGSASWQLAATGELPIGHPQLWDDMFAGDWDELALSGRTVGEAMREWLADRVRTGRTGPVPGWSALVFHACERCKKVPEDPDNHAGLCVGCADHYGRSVVL